MSDIDTRPVLEADDQIEFVDRHDPVLESGDYELTVKHTADKLTLTKAERSLKFAVKGPRFSLRPNDIAAQFPPPQSSGDFENVLPHVMLTRSTLPWERSPEKSQTAHPPSWLALLVFAEEDLVGRTKTVKVSELVGSAIDVDPPQPGAGDTFRTLMRESTDDLDEPVLVIDVPLGQSRRVAIQTPFHTASDLLPRLGELRFLSTVRKVNKAVKDEKTPEEVPRSIVIANRLPVPGKRNVAHLVSLEHQFARNGKHWAEGIMPDTMRLVSLAHWEFFCEPSHGDLAQVLGDVAIGQLALPSSNAGVAARAAATGAVPVEERHQDGTRAPAWYRGPLAPFPRGDRVDLPVRRGEELITTDLDTGMADITYAAAWKLGQLLCLRNPTVALPLQQWKRGMRHADHAVAHHLQHPEFRVDAVDAPKFPVQRWFTESLIRLGDVPFSYLIPTPELLPPETLVFFDVDRAWVRALCDGAFSVGRASEKDRQDDADLFNSLDLGPELSGVLLRSKAVSGWPDLLIDGFAKKTEKHEGPAQIVRFDRLGPETLLVLFKGRIVQADVHLHPMALHFGVDHDGARASKGAAKNLFRDGIRRVLDIARIADDLGVSGSPPEFAFKMIEGVPRVIFRSQTQ